MSTTVKLTEETTASSEPCRCACSLKSDEELANDTCDCGCECHNRARPLRAEHADEPGITAAKEPVEAATSR